ncbi:MAG: cellulose biosynthesis cyclic di-GMP-binding regulatory protein BcsB [Anaerolineae bacterium]
MLWLGWLLLWARPCHAQTPVPAATDPITLTAILTSTTPIPAFSREPNRTGAAQITFAQLGQATTELRPPLSQWSFNFNTPYRWNINDSDSLLELHYDFRQQFPGAGATPSPHQALVEVYFNEVLLTAFLPVAGENQVIRIPLTPEAVKEPGQNDQQVRLVYFWQNCQTTENQAPVVIRDSSVIHLSYQVAPLAINLADFPRPLTQNPFTSESTALVIPDRYSQADLEAAAIVAAILGQQAPQLALSLITAAQATPERLAQTGVIIIGQPRINRFLLNLYRRQLLPTHLAKDDSGLLDVANQPIAPEAGVLQEIPSEFGADQVYLIVSGGSDAGVIRAAQALSASAPRYGFEGNLAIISEFYTLNSTVTELAETSSLADLDYKDTTFYGIGDQSLSLRFFIPANWRFTDKPSLTLAYIYSALLQGSDSGLTLTLNNKPVAGISIGQASPGAQQQTIELPAADLRPGVYNRLKFDISTSIRASECDLPQLNQLWLRILETSQLRLPHTVAQSQPKASLKDAFAPFAASQDLSDVWFALSGNPTPTELQGLVTAAAWLGGLSSGAGFAPRVSTGLISDTAVLTSYHVMAFGRPTQNPLIALMNDYLPQPFVPGEDSLRQQIGNVDYRLPANFSLGLLQALPSPWNPHKTALVVTGSTPEGVAWAINTLTGPETYYGLKDDLAYIRGERIETLDSTKFIRPPLENALETMNQNGDNVALEPVASIPQPAVAASPVPAASAPPVSPLPTPTRPVALTTVTPTALLIPTIPLTTVFTPTGAITAGTIPPEYLPQGATPPSTVNYLILSLVGTGLLIAAVGAFFSWRKSKTRTLS